MTPISFTRYLTGFIFIILCIICSIESRSRLTSANNNYTVSRRKVKSNSAGNYANGGNANNNNNNNVNIKLCSKDFAKKLLCHCSPNDSDHIHEVDCWLIHKDLSQDDQTWLPFQQHKSIKKFILTIPQHGYISYLPTEIFKNQLELQMVTIKFADIREIPMFAFSNLTKLENISLTHSHIRILDEYSFANHPSLKYLNLEENEIVEIDPNAFVNIGDLSELILTNNNITIIHDKLFIQFRKLISLKLNENSIQTITNGMFEGLVNVRTLDLSYNNIEFVGDAVFSDLWKLEELDLSYNAIQKLSERAFDGLNVLQSLNLENNKIKILEKAVFSVLPALTILNLNNNLLETLTHSNMLSLMDNLVNYTTELSISDNPFVCDCRLSWVYNLHERTKSLHLKHTLEELKCIMEDYRDLQGILNTNNGRHSYDSNSNIDNHMSSSSSSSSSSDYENNYENDIHETKYTITHNHIIPLLSIHVHQLPCPEVTTEPSEIPLSRESIGFDRNWFLNDSMGILCRTHSNGILLVFIGLCLIKILSVINI